MTQAYADMLNQIGFDAEVEIVDGGVYFQTIGNAKTAAQTGFANWFADFPHPLNFYFLVDADSIQPTNNQNFGNVDDPKINDEIDRLSASTEPLNAHAEDWAALDRVPGRAAAVLRRTVRPPQAAAKFLSERMDFESARVPPGVLQRLLHVGAEGRRVGDPRGEGRAEAPLSVRLTKGRAAG